MTKEARIYNREKTLSSINGVGGNGQLHVKEPNWTGILYHTKKLTQNGLKPWMYDLES